MAGVLYGIGVGPGDPELMTLKAVRLIGEMDIIAAPGEDVKKTTAYTIALQAVPELADKELLPIHMPMVMDREFIAQYHRKGAEEIAKKLEEGKNVGFITLGDPTVYSTFSYIEKIVKEMGYQTAYISGITSFCAAAATMGIPLAEWRESLHIIPAIHRLEKVLDEEGNYVLMKSGKKINEVKEILKKSGRDVVMVENCGMPDEKRYYSVEEIPDDSGYFALIIAK
jgi:precorrin-2/cobalt-factor-2 C20-methyltransferase